MKKLYAYTKPYLKTYILCFLVSIAYSGFLSIAPFVEGMITTQLQKDGMNIAANVAGAGVQFDKILIFLRILIFIYVGNIVTDLVSQFLLTSGIQNTIRDLRNDIQKKIVKLPMSYFDGHTIGDVLSRVSNDVDTISNALQQTLIRILDAILTVGFAAIMMFVINPKMALIGILVIPGSLIITAFIMKRSSVLFRNQQNAFGTLNGYIQERYTGFAEIKLFGKQEDSIKEFSEFNNDLCENGFKAQFISGLMTPLISFLTYLAITATSLMGAINVVTGKIPLGNLQAFIRYMWQLSQPLEQITQLSSSIQAAFAATDRVFDFLEAQEEVPEAINPIPCQNAKGNVTFEHVSFGYSPDKLLIQDLNVQVQQGQMVAIVGPTGAGKTTLINLLMRFYDVSGGAIKVDGIDIRDMTRDDLRSNFGMVLQDTWLFNGSILDNIRYGNESTTEEEVIEAAKAANVHHFIQTLPGGYQMELNEESSNVSGGEKQLLTIARAILANPPIMILDEATSSVDTRLELLLQNAMKNIMKGRTSFVIAHRLSTIRNADLILVMNNGSIIEQGTHESLMEKKGFYEQLYMSQFQKNNK